MATQHYKVERSVMERVMGVVASLPYAQVHQIIIEVQQNSSGPFEGPAKEPLPTNEPLADFSPPGFDSPKKGDTT